MSKAALLEKLTDKEYRDAFISEEIDVGLPMQLRSMREGRGWKQSYVAEKTGTKQPRFSLMERTGYGKYSLNTLKKLASLFDVGLVVSFVPWNEMIDFVEALSDRRLAIPSFGDNYASLARRYQKRSANEIESLQGHLDFSAETIAVPVMAASTLPTRTTVTFTPAERGIEMVVTVPPNFFAFESAGGTGSHAYTR